MYLRQWKLQIHRFTGEQSQQYNDLKKKKFLSDAGQVVMTNTNVSQEKLTSTRCEEDELEVIENGGLSPHPSLRTEDDACSEIIRIEQGGSQERDPEQNTTLERIVRTLQVSDQFESCGIIEFP